MVQLAANMSWPVLVFAEYRVFDVGSKSRQSKLNKKKKQQQQIKWNMKKKLK